MRNPHMKFQDSSFNGLKVTVGTESVTHPRTNGRSKSNVPHQLFQIGGIKIRGGSGWGWFGLGGGGRVWGGVRVDVNGEVKLL